MTKTDEKLFIAYAHSGRKKSELAELETRLNILQKQFEIMGFQKPFCCIDYKKTFANFSLENIMNFCFCRLDTSSKIILYVDKIIQSSGIAKELDYAQKKSIDVLLFKNRELNVEDISNTFPNYNWGKLADIIIWDNGRNKSDTIGNYQQSLMASKTFGKLARKSFLYP